MENSEENMYVDIEAQRDKVRVLCKISLHFLMAFVYKSKNKSKNSEGSCGECKHDA